MGKERVRPEGSGGYGKAGSKEGLMRTMEWISLLVLGLLLLFYVILALGLITSIFRKFLSHADNRKTTGSSEGKRMRIQQVLCPFLILSVISSGIPAAGRAAPATGTDRTSGSLSRLVNEPYTTLFEKAPHLHFSAHSIDRFRKELRGPRPISCSRSPLPSALLLDRPGRLC